MLRRILWWGFVLFIVFFVATQPSQAAGLVHQGFGALHSAANSMARFVDSL
jgi:hypothetical protein